MLSLSNEGAEGDPPSDIRLRALSLGAGVQSTTLALMARSGPCPTVRFSPIPAGSRELSTSISTS